MNRRVIITAVLTLFVGVVVAQEPEEFTKQVEIEKDYSAGVSRAERIEVEPTLLDTTIIRPQMRYSIVSVAQRSNFTTEKITPVEFSTAGWNKQENVYLNLGVGAPLQSEADLYWTPIKSRDRLLIVGLNHEGVEGRQTTMENEEVSGLMLKNRLATHYSTPLGRRLNTRLAADVDYQGVVANPYGGVGVVAPRNIIDNNAFRGDVKVSGEFSEKSDLSYVARVRGNYALANYGAGRAAAEDGTMWRYCVDFTVNGLDSVKRWLPSRVTAYYYGVRSTGWSPYYDTSVTLIPEWSFRIGEWLPVNVMAGYDYMVYKGAVQSWRGVVGSVDVAWVRNPKVVPWVKISNDIDAGLFAPALWTNPYHNLLPSDSRKVYRGEAGVKGALGVFDYELKGGFEHLSKYFYTQVLEGSPVLLWGADAKGVDMWYVEGAFGWTPLRGLSVEGGVRFNAPHYHTEAAVVGDNAYSIRKLKGQLAVRYSPLKRLHLCVSAEGATATSAQLVAKSGEGVEVCGEVAMPGYIDLGLSAEWQFTNRLTVWLRGDNLLNQTIYEWATYRALGVGGRVGVALTF